MKLSFLIFEREDIVVETINVRGLPEELAQQIQRLVELLKERTTQDTFPVTEEDVEPGSFPLSVKGKVTREEIYDYL